MGYHAMPQLDESCPNQDRERLLAVALRPVIAELRLVEPGDYIAFLRMDVPGNIADIVDSSSQLHLAPGALTFASSGEARVTWSTPPVVELDLKFRDADTEVHFSLALGAGAAAIRIDHFPRSDETESDAAQTLRLKAALQRARLPYGNA
ncbi:hypothetical protein [Aureimonas frigidaquae]|uniref:hypothetical protein n=1 Tax=Aureimonas frigidaquae TaxID=424757 RepID=UPI000782238E|nr:hypothetical protein [Aureimonas frigidaquae]